MIYNSEAFCSFSVESLEIARAFYSEIPGLEVKANSMGILELQFKDNYIIMIYPRKDHKAARFTISNFPVEKIEESVDYLTSKGLIFEQYSGDLQTDAKGICRTDGKKPYVAWFKDPSVNILSWIEN